MSKQLSDKRIREIDAAHIVYYDDSPELSDAELDGFRPAKEIHPELFMTNPKKKADIHPHRC